MCIPQESCPKQNNLCCDPSECLTQLCFLLSQEGSHHKDDPRMPEWGLRGRARSWPREEHLPENPQHRDLLYCAVPSEKGGQPVPLIQSLNSLALQSRDLKKHLFSLPALLTATPDVGPEILGAGLCLMYIGGKKRQELVGVWGVRNLWMPDCTTLVLFPVFGPSLLCIVALNFLQEAQIFVNL